MPSHEATAVVTVAWAVGRLTLVKLEAMAVMGVRPEVEAVLEVGGTVPGAMVAQEQEVRSEYSHGEE
jgi:hypothetical protein